MLLRQIDFQNERSVAQIDYPEVWSSVQGLCNKYEPIFLVRVLGRTLANQITFGLLASSRDEYITTQGDLLIQVFNDAQMAALYEKLEQPMANFVYFYWLKKQTTLPFANGQGVLNGEGTTSVNSYMKQVQIWNEMVEGVDELHEWMQGQFTIEGKNYPYINEYGL